MFLHKLKLAATAAVALMLVAGGLGAVAFGVADDPPQPEPNLQDQAAAPVPEPEDEVEIENWSLSLQEAIRLGLANADFVRIVSQPGGKAPLKIVAEGAITDPEFEAKVTDLVRRIESAYWMLSVRRVEVPPAERAVNRARELLNREELKVDAGAGDGKTSGDVRIRLNKLNRDLGGRKRSVIEANGELRKILGLPANDELEIIPSTTPALPPLKWDYLRRWRAEKGTSLTEAEEPEFFSKAKEVDSIQRRLQRAPWDRRAAVAELAAEQERYESGRGLPDDYLNVIDELVRSTDRESGLGYQYNTAIAELRKIMGTLLNHHQIAIVGESQPEPAPAPAPAEPMEAGVTEEAAGKTYSFHVSIGAGPKPFEIRGSLTVTPAR